MLIYEFFRFLGSFYFSALKYFENTPIAGITPGRSIKRISDEREMVLNAKKTCIFIANFTKNHQFKPMFGIPGTNRPMKVVLETKLLGYWLTPDLKPAAHVEFIVGKAMKRIWIIRRLKAVGASDAHLASIFQTLIRPILETSCPVFHSMLICHSMPDILTMRVPVSFYISRTLMKEEQTCACSLP